MLKLTDLMQKDVINDDDGNKLGKIIDINLELDGSINSIIIHLHLKSNQKSPIHRIFLGKPTRKMHRNF